MTAFWNFGSLSTVSGRCQQDVGAGFGPLVVKRPGHTAG